MINPHYMPGMDMVDFCGSGLIADLLVSRVIQALKMYDLVLHKRGDGKCVSVSMH